MKRVAIISNNYSVQGHFNFLLNALRAEGVRYMRHKNRTLIAEGVSYHFLQLKHRNLSQFVKKYGKVDHLFLTNELYTSVKTKSYILDKKLQGLVGDDLSKVTDLSRQTRFPELLEWLPGGLSRFGFEKMFFPNKDGVIRSFYCHTSNLPSNEPVSLETVFFNEEQAREAHILKIERDIRGHRDEIDRLEALLSEYKRGTASNPETSPIRTEDPSSP